MILGRWYCARLFVLSGAILIICFPRQYLSQLTTVGRCKQNTTDSRLVDNGYEGLVVWIGDEVKEDYNLIKDLKTLIQATSEKMFQVTKRRAFIRQVSVHLPRAWGRPPSELEKDLRAKTFLSTQSRGDFHLRNRTPRDINDREPWQLGDEEAQVEKPYVLKPTPCGFSGRYLRMTPEFVRFGDKARNKIGDPSKIMMREWAKLRWGVYDETPKPFQGVNFYTHTDLETYPTMCSKAIKGKIINPSRQNETCDLQDTNTNVQCQFEPDKSQAETDENVTKAKFASLMYRPDLDYVDHFCDTEEESGEVIPPEQQHNSEAPTIHNLHCESQSVWEVMRNHQDFAYGENPPKEDEFQLPSVQFELFQHPDRRIVLVLDISTSMNTKRMRLMRQAASQFIDTVPVFSWVGIVAFAAKAYELSELLEIVNEDTRNTLKERLPKYPVTGTSIGSGLNSALKVLNSSGPIHMRDSGGTLLVLTDGKEHNNPKIEDITQDIVDFGVRVNTIAFGYQATIELENLAELTGGTTFSASSGDFSSGNELREAFLATIENKHDGVVIVSSQSIKIAANDTKEHAFYIDPSIGVDTRITILYSDSVAPMVGIEDPTGDIKWEDEEYGMSNITARFLVNDEFSTIIIEFLGYMMPGMWKVFLNNKRKVDDITTQISILSHPKEEEQTLTLSPALLCRQIHFTGTESVIVYAHLSVGELAVIDASVTAAITRPLTNTGMVDVSYVNLMDDGLGADVVANDGIYSGYFTSFTLEGRYNVKVSANSNRGLARTDSTFILGIGERIELPTLVDVSDLLRDNDERLRNRRRTTSKRSASPGFLPSFQRSSSGAGAFTVNDITAKVCPDGYKYFQNSCYKFVRDPLISTSEASSYCELEGGYLAEINSNQEFTYIVDTVADWDTWFKGLEKNFRDSEDLSFELVSETTSNEDQDLNALTELLKNELLNKDLFNTVETFEPDLGGLTRKEINRIVRKLGIQAVSDIPLLIEEILARQNEEATTPLMRIRRQAMEPSLLRRVIDNALQTTTAESTTETVTLALAKKEPEKYGFESSGQPDLGCSWIQDRRIVETSGKTCMLKKAFICERPKNDLIPPSRITDLKISKKNEEIVEVIWSASGDDYRTGNASKYEVRTLRSYLARAKLMKHFDKGKILRKELLTSGELDNPKSPGEKEKIVVNITKVAECTPHAILDVVLVLPQRFLARKGLLQSQLDDLLEALNTVFSQFILSEHEVVVSAVAFKNTTASLLLKDSTDIAAVNNLLRQGIVDDNENTNNELSQVLGTLTSSGRSTAPKVFLWILDREAFETPTVIKNTAGVFTIIVAVGLDDKRAEVRTKVSYPDCKNAIFAENWQKLNSSAELVVNQMCYARAKEYMAIGVVAIDDQGLRGATSNIESLAIPNIRAEVVCQPEPKTNTQPMIAGDNTAAIGLAIGIPFGVVIAIIAAFLLFSQFKKYKKKRERARKAEEEQAAVEAGKSNANRKTNLGNSAMLLLQNLRNTNLKLKTNKTGPVTRPPV